MIQDPFRADAFIGPNDPDIRGKHELNKKRSKGGKPRNLKTHFVGWRLMETGTTWGSLVRLTAVVGPTAAATRIRARA
jgi:hypothetical protein